MAANHRSIHAHIHTWPQIRDAAEPKTYLERPTPGIRQPELTDGVHLNRLVRWISRSLNTMLSEFKLVDCRSLDVLLVCADDLTHSTLLCATDSLHGPSHRRELAGRGDDFGAE